MLRIKKVKELQKNTKCFFSFYKRTAFRSLYTFLIKAKNLKFLAFIKIKKQARFFKVLPFKKVKN
jgi:hypothetical protein